MKKSNILLIGNQFNVIDMCDKLVEKGHDVLVAQDPDAAEGKIEDLHPDLVVVDIISANGRSIEFCQKIRKVTKAPVLFQSICGMSMKKEKIVSTEHEGFPFLSSMEELVQQIESQL